MKLIRTVLLVRSLLTLVGLPPPPSRYLRCVCGGKGNVQSPCAPSDGPAGRPVRSAIGRPADVSATSGGHRFAARATGAGATRTRAHVPRPPPRSVVTSDTAVADTYRHRARARPLTRTNPHAHTHTHKGSHCRPTVRHVLCVRTSPSSLPPQNEFVVVVVRCASGVPLSARAHLTAYPAAQRNYSARLRHCCRRRRVFSHTPGGSSLCGRHSRSLSSFPPRRHCRHTVTTTRVSIPHTHTHTHTQVYPFNVL